MLEMRSVDDVHASGSVVLHGFAMPALSTIYDG